MDQAANRRLAFGLAGTAVAMVGLAYASVPLYRLFCQVTGYGGTTGRAEAPAAPAGTRVMTVRFDANVGGANLPWTFEPADRALTLNVGEQRLAFFRAHNKSEAPVTGTATFNVTPHKAGAYFQKVACFCFTEQRLDPGESMDMPVSFFVDPAIVDDPNLRDVSTITLSYTFFRSKKDAEADLRQPGATARRPASGADAPAIN